MTNEEKNALIAKLEKFKKQLKDDSEAVFEDYKWHYRPGARPIKPGIYPITPYWPQQAPCTCSRPMALYIPPGYYFQCECGNRIYGSPITL